MNKYEKYLESGRPPEKPLLEIARIISGGDEATLLEADVCVTAPTAWFSIHEQEYRDRGISHIQRADDLYLIQWLGLVDLLEKYNHVCERDWKDEKEDFVYFLSHVSGIKRLGLNIQNTWFDETDEIQTWCSILNKKWQPQQCCMAVMDINSDSYVLFPCRLSDLTRLQNLAARAGEFIGMIGLPAPEPERKTFSSKLLSAFSRKQKQEIHCVTDRNRININKNIRTKSDIRIKESPRAKRSKIADEGLRTNNYHVRSSTSRDRDDDRSDRIVPDQDINRDDDSKIIHASHTSISENPETPISEPMGLNESLRIDKDIIHNDTKNLDDKPDDTSVEIDTDAQSSSASSQAQTVKVVKAIKKESVMKQAKVYIDGKDGTTGLQIYDRLAARPDLELLLINEEKRKDSTERAKLMNTADIVFLCLPDAAALEAVELISNPDTRIIDASTIHRTNPTWDYGFPELSQRHRERIQKSRRVANPGCHATGFISAVYPLIATGSLSKDTPLTCFSLTGYSGGGKKMIAQYEDEKNPKPVELFSPRIYGLNLSHKHLPEMQAVCGLTHTPIFCPIVDDYYKGMATTITLHDRSAKEIWEILSDYYQNQTLVKVAPLGWQAPMIAANTLAGYDHLILTVNGNGEQTIVTALFDNLGKGASGAAVQNMNLMLGLDETTGLNL